MGTASASSEAKNASSGVFRHVLFEAAEKVNYGTKICGSTIASSNILRFPRASVEPPRTSVLRGVSPISYFPQESPYIRDAKLRRQNNIFIIHHFFSAHLAFPLESRVFSSLVLSFAS